MITNRQFDEFKREFDIITSIYKKRVFRRKEEGLEDV